MSKVMSTLKKNGFKDTGSLVVHVSSEHGEGIADRSASFEFPPLPPDVVSGVSIVVLTLPSQVTVTAISYLRRHYPHLHLITEKPAASSSSSVSELLSALSTTSSSRNVGGVYVLENWVNKPSFVSFRRSLELSLFSSPAPPVSLHYELHLSQLRDDLSPWRTLPSLSGGPLRDVGVHAVRALRELFGEVTVFLKTKTAEAPTARGGEEGAEEDCFIHDEQETTVRLSNAILHCPHNDYSNFLRPERGVTAVGSI